MTLLLLVAGIQGGLQGCGGAGRKGGRLHRAAQCRRRPRSGRPRAPRTCHLGQGQGQGSRLSGRINKPRKPCRWRVGAKGRAVVAAAVLLGSWAHCPPPSLVLGTRVGQGQHAAPPPARATQLYEYCTRAGANAALGFRAVRSDLHGATLGLAAIRVGAPRHPYWQPPVRPAARSWAARGASGGGASGAVAHSPMFLAKDWHAMSGVTSAKQRTDSASSSGSPLA